MKIIPLDHILGKRRAHSGLSMILLFTCLLGFAIIILAPYVIPIYRVHAVPYDNVRLVAVAILATLVIAMYMTTDMIRYRIYLTVYAAVSMLHTLLRGYDLSSSVLLIIIGILSVVLYEPYPVNFLICLVFVFIMSGSLGLSMSLFSKSTLTAIVVSVITAIVGALLSYFGAHIGKLRNELISQQAVVQRLAENVVKLTQANVSSLSFAASVEDESKTEERRRLAQEIHDLVGYTLTTNITLMEAVKLMSASDPQQIPEYVEQIRKNSESALDEIRKVLRNLHSREEQLDITALLVKLRKVYSYSTGVEVAYEFGNIQLKAMEQFRDILYNFIREALINSFRHGQATSVKVFFWQHSDYIEITVADNGVGASLFEEDIGIKGMRERAARMNGSISFPRVPNGFKIRLTIPINGVTGRLENATTHR